MHEGKSLEELAGLANQVAQDEEPRGTRASSVADGLDLVVDAAVDAAAEVVGNVIAGLLEL